MVETGSRLYSRIAGARAGNGGVRGRRGEPGRESRGATGRAHGIPLQASGGLLGSIVTLGVGGVSSDTLWREKSSRQAISQLRTALSSRWRWRPAVRDFPFRPNLLERVKQALDGDTVLLSFHLAQTSSLWAVSNSGLSLYRLPDRAALTKQAMEFRQAVMAGSTDSERLGRSLYHTLFGAVGAEYRSKHRWLLSLDDGMFDLPFAALVVGGSSEAPEYLIERHSLQRISGAAAWVDRKPAAGRIDGEFVGVGDAIYNTADVRWRGAEQDRFGARFLRWAGWSSRVSAAAPTDLSLSRLPGSGPEIESCAREWGMPAALSNT